MPSKTTLLTLAAAFIANPALLAMGASTATVHFKCTVPNTVALTFDDGPYKHMNEIVEMLNDVGARGTFFVNGNNYGCIYDSGVRKALKNAYDHGHQIASHTWRHQDLATLSKAQLQDEFKKTQQAIQRITGGDPAFMRPPYGSYNDLVVEVAKELGETVVIWDVDSGDSVGASALKQRSNIDAAFEKNPSTALVLMHETIRTTVKETLPYVLKKAKDAGFRLVTVADCLGMSPYKSKGIPGTPDADWTC